MWALDILFRRGWIQAQQFLKLEMADGFLAKRMEPPHVPSQIGRSDLARMRPSMTFSGYRLHEHSRRFCRRAPSIFPSSAIPLAYYNWEDSFSYSLLPTDGQHISFNITAPNRLAKGELYPNNITVSGRQPVSYALKGLEFIPMTPCRVVDTQGAFGPLGGPELTANTSREFDLPRGDCSIPNTAVAYSLNSIVVPETTLGFITIWPSGRPRPVVSTSNSDWSD